MIWRWRGLDSLRGRILIAAALVSLFSILLTSLALERAFADAAQSAREERLLAQLYLLMAAAEFEEDRLLMPEPMAEPRFNLPDSGLAARIFGPDGQLLWQSVSALGHVAPRPRVLAPGERRFELIDADQLAEEAGLMEPSGVLSSAYGVRWATESVPVELTFAVAESRADLRGEIAGFRRSLWAWLLAMSGVLLLALVAALHWGLSPLRQISTEVAALQAGRQGRLQGRYPGELRPLTDNLNRLLDHEHARQRRLDHALGDLAHSLKTPLAVMRGAIDEVRAEQDASTDASDARDRGAVVGAHGPSPWDLIQDQTEQMAHIVAFQLQRARASAGGASGLSPPVSVRRTAKRVIDSLQKVYADKSVVVKLKVSSDLQFAGEEADLMEILGNLLDNGFKWCRGQVRLTAGTNLHVTAKPVSGRSTSGVGDTDSAAREGLWILVEDDGPGIAPDHAADVLGRGTRADERLPGHGIGLAVVAEIAAATGGRVVIDSSTLGGARLQVRLGAGATSADPDASRSVRE